jgi:hypothetical protein
MERQAKDGTFYKQVGDDEWEPVTRASKDGTVYKKVGQDDWEPVEQESSGEPMGKPGEGPSMLAEVADPVLRGLDYAGGLVRQGVASLSDAARMGVAAIDPNQEVADVQTSVREGDLERVLKGDAPLVSQHGS